MKQAPAPLGVHPPAVPLWRNVSFQLMWTSTAAAGFGDRMIELVALPMLIGADQEANSGPAMAGIYFWYFLPWIVITPIGGWLADTLPRKWILFACDVGRALVLLAAFLLVPAGLKSTDPAIKMPLDQQWKIFVVLLGIGTLASIFNPSKNAIVPQLVQGAKLNAANSILVGIGVIASLIGYFGNEILKHDSVRRGLEVAFLLYAISGFLFLFMKPRPHERLDAERSHSQWERFKSAVRYIRTHRPVVELVGMYALIWSVATVMANVIGPLCLKKYGFSTKEMLEVFIYPLIAMGVGMMLAGVVLSTLNITRGANRLVLGTLIAAGVVVLLLALIPNFYVGIGLCFFIGLLGGMSMITISTITQRIVPNYILGRVCGVRETVSNLVCVGINLAIWQLPLMRKANAALPEADTLLIYSLYPLAGFMIVAGLLGWRGLRGKQE